MNNPIRKCPKCGTQSTMFFCPNCGNVFEFPSFVSNNEARKHSLQEFIKKVISVAQQQKIEVSSAIDNSQVRNAIYRKYYEQIAYLQKLCSNKVTQSYFMNSGSNMFEQMNQFAEKCELGECQIAVVGTVKAGKSAFINALIGEEIASSYPTPETASVTKFRNSEKGDYVTITFYSSKEWQDLWNSVNQSSSDAVRNDEHEDFISLYKELKAEQIRLQYLNKDSVTFSTTSLSEMKSILDKFTSARYPEHFFAKEVEVGLSNFFAPSNVVIVDTPGLDDPVPYRTDITRRYLHKANVILLCIRSNRPEISSTELTQLSYIFQELRYHKDRIITFGTQIDEPRDMLNFWKKYTLPEYLKYLSRKTLYGSKEIAEQNIFPVSAYYYFFIKKAIENPNIFMGKTKEDKLLRLEVKEIIRRYYDYPDLEELIEEFGEEEAKIRYRSPRQLFEEHKEELLNMSQVPMIRQMLLNGPIHNANDIIIQDIQRLYVHLNQEINKISSEIASLRHNTIKLADADDVRLRIDVLTKKIAEEKKQNKEQAEKLSELLASLESESLKALTKIKS